MSNAAKSTLMRMRLTTIRNELAAVRQFIKIGAAVGGEARYDLEQIVTI